MSQFAGYEKSFRAGGDLNTSTSDFRPVYINSSQSVLIASTTVATNTIGILQNRPNSGTGAACHVRLFGPTSKVYLNDTCSAGDIIIMGAGAGPIRGTGLTQTANYTLVGKALESSVLTGTIIEVMLGNPRQTVGDDTTTATVIAE